MDIDDNELFNNSNEIIPLNEDPDFILDIANGHNSIIEENYPEAVSNFRKVLDDILNTGQLRTSKELLFFYKALEGWNHKYEAIDNRIVEESPFIYSNFILKFIKFLEVFKYLSSQSIIGL